MEPIYPLHEERINMFCGMPVCIVTKEGTRHIGILSHCKSGKITLNAHTKPETAVNVVEEQAREATASAKGAKKKKNAKKATASAASDEKAQTQAYPYDPYLPYYRPYNPWGEFFAIDLALIAFLFLLF
ncbi:hypothetical protein FHS18_006854 [Paenibacillus phyllosphaerae]|uniref:Uncharacterized protein n=1 Tax=Paenibacillus phyllosphaerae TaxID=274593 RepID=A0A7W5B6P6_9BACL|nr:hypothetical protein [Paenibacillus phyllosphaerae]MBB3114711.1 hypothetical protein [Paenibacillus phyllosphaerae]